MKVKSKMFIASVLGSLGVVTIAFLIASEAYFNSKEVSLATDRCFEDGGSPVVELAVLNLEYTFECKGS